MIVAVLLATTSAQAQISPGQLSRAHADLEGNDRCLECHRKGQGVGEDLCLICHTVLKERIDAGQGLHARPDYQKCHTCHIEHHGRDFELIYWGDGGPEALDHNLTGYVLEGRHRALGCRDCHRSEFVRPALADTGKNLDRTFLGLGTECLSCHSDPHREQFEDVGCRSCHELEAWIPAPLFDHQQTSFPLTGQHRDVACASCHPAVISRDAASQDVNFVQYSGIAAESCMNCHDDPHESRFGQRCESCHATDSWRATIDEGSFDHDQTRYPLLGLHQDVACADCHTSDKLTDPIAEFDRCESCHEDVHEGQFLSREGGGDCTSCHDVEGFRPSRYTLEDHQKSSYPLEESHLAVPCFSCHSDPLDAAPSMTRFRFEWASCTDCHDDVHEGTLDTYLEPDKRDAKGCVSCHGLTAWKTVAFDHGRSSYPLTGAHIDVACESCHPREEHGLMRHGLMKLSGVPTTCTGCHDDPHGGQFERPDPTHGGELLINCESCHTIVDWQPTRFDHNRDATYALEGAHVDVPCASCHPTIVDELTEQTRVLYRPRPTECAGCHQGDSQ